MLMILTVDECRESFNDAVSSSIRDGRSAESCDRIDVEGFVDSFLEAWLFYIESNEREGASQLAGPLEISWPSQDCGKEKPSATFPFFGAVEDNLPMAARTPAVLLGTRQIRIQEYLFNLTVDTLQFIFSGVLPENLSGELLVGYLVHTVLSVIKTQYSKPRLCPNERCIYIKAWAHNGGQYYAIESVNTWFGQFCDIPEKRYWRCDYRGSERACLYDTSSTEDILDSLCEKGFFESNDAGYYRLCDPRPRPRSSGNDKYYRIDEAM